MKPMFFHNKWLKFENNQLSKFRETYVTVLKTFANEHRQEVIALMPDNYIIS